MRRWLALAFGVALACSYSLELPHCKVTCTGPSDCPADSTCRSGYCQQGSADECTADAATSTGGTGADASVGTGGATGTGGAPATGGAPGTGGAPPPPPPDAGPTSSACAAGCGMGTICCMPPWNCQGMCIPDCRPTGTCQMNGVCDLATGFCQPDCRSTGGNCPPGSGLTCNTTTGLCR